MQCTFDCPIHRSTGGTITVERVLPGKFIEGTFVFDAERRLGSGPPAVAVSGSFRIRLVKSSR